jgi:glycosyltransferase involved in cell wall biosynthesis
MDRRISPSRSWWSRRRDEGVTSAEITASLPQVGLKTLNRLLIIARELTRGGAAYLALRHARTLSTQYTIDILVTGPCDDDFLCEFPEQILIYRLDNSSISREGDWRQILHRFALDHAQLTPFHEQYHALLATSTFPDLAACAAVCTVRAEWRALFLVDESLSFYTGLEPAEQDIVEQCIAEADLVLPVSQRLWHRMAERCSALRARPWQRLWPPVDVDAVLRLAEESQSVIGPREVPSVITVSRLSPEKQITQSVRLQHRLIQSGLRFRWYVIGEGLEEAALRAEIRELGMEDDFILLGRRENIFSILKACDVFALLSLSEGCPTVVLEALTLGVPVIMTDVNGSNELVDHGTTGLIVANNPEAIVDGLTRIIDDASLRRSFRENLAHIAANRDADDSGPSLMKLVKERGPAKATPMVTILIPTYNQERFIDCAIASALAQDYPSLEVVVLDDASTDETGRVAQTRSYDRRLRYVRNDRNLGRVANYHRGLTEYARGDWVLTLDGDDYLSDPGFISRACETIDRHRDRPIVFLQAGHRVHYLDGQLSDVDILPPIEGDERVLTGADYLRFVFETGFFTHLGSLYRRESALQTGFYTAEISSSDMDSLLRLALDGEVVVLNHIAGYWVQHGSNTSSHLALKNLGANVRIFRRAARAAVRRRLGSWNELGASLTRYEVHILLCLFDTMIGRTVLGPLDLARFLGIALTINPALFRDQRFLAACRGYAQHLVRPALETGHVGRLALRAYRIARAVYRALGGEPLIEALAR